ncbi:hypothetical protein J6590_089357 [Homalodisca vitripennis]|nr:hypothetical protein J6590_089357 [Homalodisca vitripennis]
MQVERKSTFTLLDETKNIASGAGTPDNRIKQSRSRLLFGWVTSVRSSLKAVRLLSRSVAVRKS